MYRWLAGAGATGTLVCTLIGLAPANISLAVGAAGGLLSRPRLPRLHGVWWVAAGFSLWCVSAGVLASWSDADVSPFVGVNAMYSWLAFPLGLVAFSQTRWRVRAVRWLFIACLAAFALALLQTLVGFDADGLPSLVSNVPVGSVTITAYMQTALGKSSAAALLTYLGASAYGQTLLAMADAAALRTSLGTAYATALEALTATASDKAVTPAALLGLWQTGTALASNATLDLTAGTDGFQRTISDASNAIATIQGTQPVVRLTAGADGVTLTHHASNLISRTASDIVMRTGDSVTLLRIGTNQWREIGFDPVPNWKSANLTSVGANSTHTVTHYLGNRVGAVRLMGAVKTGQTDNGWADSDFTGNARLEIARATTTNLGWWLFVDDTEVTVRTGSGGIGMIVESSGGTGVALAPAKWNLWLEIDPR